MARGRKNLSSEEIEAIYRLGESQEYFYINDDDCSTIAHFVVGHKLTDKGIAE